jgi:multidrug efflux system membrane fusion protein
MVENRLITTGLTYQNETVVEKGLSAGETVVTDGQLRLAPKMKVTVKTNDEGRMQNSETNK